MVSHLWPGTSPISNNIGLALFRFRKSQVTLLIYPIWLPEACQRRSLSGGEGLRRPKAYAEGVGGQREGGGEGGEGRGKRGEGRGGRETNTEENIGSIGESIPDGWRPEASPPAGRSSVSASP